MISEYDRSLHHVSVQDLLSKRALLARSFFIKDLLARSLQQVPLQCLCARSQKEMSWQDVCTGSLNAVSYLLARSQQISMQCVYTRSPNEVSWQDLCPRDFCTRSLKEPIWQNLCKRPLGKTFEKISVQAL